MARIIWNRSGDPSGYVSEQLAIERWQLRQAIHKIKASADIKADEKIVIYDDGTVRDADGESIGNIHDEI